MRNLHVEVNRQSTGGRVAYLEITSREDSPRARTKRCSFVLAESEVQELVEALSGYKDRGTYENEY